MRRAVLAVLLLDMLVIGLLLAPGVVPGNWRMPFRLLDAGLMLALALMLLSLLRRLSRLLAERKEVQTQQQMLFDAMPIGLVVWDADDRLQHSNADFRRLYAPLCDLIVAGTPFEALMRAAVSRGLVPEARGREDAWLKERLAQHLNPGPPLLRHTADGHWRRVVEQRLPDGRLLGYSVDVTEVQEAIADAERARERLRGAVDALPATFELYDAEDRLVLHNEALRLTYPQMAPYLDRGLSFADLARLNIASGGQPDAAADPEAWIAMRQQQRVQPHLVGGVEHPAPDGRRLRMYERRLADGSLVAIRVDVTALEQARADAALARARLEDAIEALPTGVELYDGEDRLVLANEAMRVIYPQLRDLEHERPTFEELVRANFARGAIDIAPDRFESWLAERLRQRRLGGPPDLAQVRGRWYRRIERPTREGGIIGVRIDVTELEHARAAEARATERLHDAIEALPAGFELYDANDRMVLVNSTMKRMYPAVADLLGEGLRFDELVRANWQRGSLVVANEDIEGWLAERLVQRHAGGPPRVHQLRSGPWVRTYERRTREGGIVGVRIDVTELVERDRQLAKMVAELDTANAELRRQAESDPLTGIANRRRFECELAAACEAGAPVALLLFDIDHFKRFNDHHGHPAGDACLRRVAAVLTAVLRCPRDLAARIGGEEFTVLLPGEGAEGACAVAQRCAEVLADAGITHGDSPLGPHVTFSIGVAAGDGFVSAVELTECADAALYEAKRQGRARWRLHSAG